MAMIDPERERQRLQEVYSRHSDGELEQIAADGSELTDIARKELRAELVKRGLYIGQPDESAEPAGMEFRDLVAIRTFWNLLDAELAKGMLNAAGIDAFLFDENMVRLDWFNANALGGIKLRVDAQNVEDANRILDEGVSGNTRLDDIAPGDGSNS